MNASESCKCCMVRCRMPFQKKYEIDISFAVFEWKKAVTKNQAKLLIKLADFVAECEQLYDIKIVYGNVIKIKHLKRLRKKLYALKNAGNITFVHGI